MTRREGEILLLLATGATNRTIAERLGISIITVKSHVTNLLRKLGLQVYYRGKSPLFSGYRRYR